MRTSIIRGIVIIKQLTVAKEYFKEFDDKLSEANLPNLLLPKVILATLNPSVAFLLTETMVET